jgi:hypothetical protein
MQEWKKANNSKVKVHKLKERMTAKAHEDNPLNNIRLDALAAKYSRLKPL